MTHFKGKISPLGSFFKFLDTEAAFRIKYLKILKNGSLKYSSVLFCQFKNA
jgi:hypothetical protein